MIKGSLQTPFILFRTSGSTGVAKYIAHSRVSDRSALDRGLHCLEAVYDGEVIVNAFWPAELNGAYYFTEAICRDLGASYIGLGPGCIDELEYLAGEIPNVCIATTGTNVRRYLETGISFKKILFSGDAPTPTALTLADNKGIEVLPLAYSTTEHGPIAHFHVRCGDRFHYKFFDEADVVIDTALSSSPLQGELRVKIRGGTLSDIMPTGDVIKIVSDENPRVFKILGRLADTINFQGGLLNKSQFEYQLTDYFGTAPRFQCIYSRGATPRFRLCIAKTGFDVDELHSKLFANYEIQFALAGSDFSIEPMEASSLLYARGKLPTFIEQETLEAASIADKLEPVILGS